MRYQTTDSFRADHARLTVAEKALFQDAVRVINDAYTVNAGRSLLSWPAKLRIKRMQRTPGIWEMTWSFVGPDGRATFQIVDIDGEPAIRWRRVGGHEIFRAP